MPVSLENMREMLLPGMWEITASPTVVSCWDEIFESGMFANFPGGPVFGVPLSIAVPVVTAAVVAKNPEVTRRSIWGWLRPLLR